jgi:hypothetical protein
MPPRRSARVAAVAERQCTALAPLPHALVLLIFSLVPVDQRLRCVEVCKGWHVTLNERSLWLCLDMSATAGLARPATQALLRAAAARAGGQLQTLHLTDSVAITHETLLAVARANADTLTELRMEGCCVNPHTRLLVGVGAVEAVLGAAPRLRSLDADVHCANVTEAHRLLRNKGAFAALRVRKLRVSTRDEAGVLALAADLPVHTWLTEVRLDHAPLGTLAALDAVVDAALALRLASLALMFCNVTPASAPSLARLISGGALTRLCVLENNRQQLLEQPAAALIADALRANSSLTSLEVHGCRFWEDAVAALLLLRALTAHRSLRTLNLNYNSIQPGDQQAPALGAALGALVTANTSALHDLRLSCVALNDTGLLALGLLLDALPLNTHLRTLDLDYNSCTEDFARNRLLPAVRANTSLRHLSVLDEHDNEFLREAAALVAVRNAAAAP